MPAKREKDITYTMEVSYRLTKKTGNDVEVLNNTMMEESTFIPADATAEERAALEIAQNQKEKSIAPRLLRGVAEAVEELADFGITLYSGGFTPPPEK